jgi:hypothetical protein
MNDRKNLDFPAKSTDAGARRGLRRNSDQDAADLADLELSAFNRFSNPALHNEPWSKFMTWQVQAL